MHAEAVGRIRVVLADDQEVARVGTKRILSRCVDIVVVAEARSGAEALRQVQALDPDVLVAEMRLPDLTAIQLAEECAGTPVRVLAYSAYKEEGGRQCIKSKLSGYLLKQDAPERLVEAVRGVARGEEGWFSPRIAQQMTVLARQNSIDQRLGKYGITPRECEVLKLVARGLSNQQIADALHIAKNTVRSHLSHIYAKLDMHARHEVMVWAWAHGLVEMKQVADALRTA